MTIKTSAIAAALTAGILGFADKADAQVIINNGGTSYPGGGYSSGVVSPNSSPSSSTPMDRSGYVPPNYSLNYTPSFSGVYPTPYNGSFYARTSYPYYYPSYHSDYVSPYTHYSNMYSGTWGQRGWRW